MLEVETEVGERRDRLHFGAFDCSVGVEREGDVGVRIHGAVGPPGKIKCTPFTIFKRLLHAKFDLAPEGKILHLLLALSSECPHPS